MNLSILLWSPGVFSQRVQAPPRTRSAQKNSEFPHTMKILFLSHRVPFPPDKGDRIRSYNIIKFLARSRSIVLVAAAHEQVHLDAYAELRRYCSDVDIVRINYGLRRLLSCFYLFTKQPLTLPAFYSKELHSAVRDRLRATAFDLIYVYSSQMAQYVLDVDSAPKLMDFIDLDSQKWLDYASKCRQPMKSIYHREGIALRSFEKQVASLCESVVFAAEREARLFRDIAPNASSTVVQNGVDVGSSVNVSRHENKLVFVGAMDYFPNIDAMLYFTQEILPLVQRSIPEVELCIVGRNPSRQIKKLSRLKNVVVTGHVDKIAPHLRNAAVSVAPLRIARGIQNKILEAMAHGVPLVTTTAALEGIEAMAAGRVVVTTQTGGNSELVADGKTGLLVPVGDVAAMATAMLRLLEDPDRRERMGQLGRNRVRERFARDITVAQYRNLYLSINEKSKGSLLDTRASLNSRRTPHRQHRNLRGGALDSRADALPGAPTNTGLDH